MDNTPTLTHGAKIAQQLISDHILNRILIPLANDMIALAIAKRSQIGHNMTGNTINAYVAVVYQKGVKVWDSYSSDMVPWPTQTKLSAGDRYRAGKKRWDGDIQIGTFVADVDTDMQVETSANTMSFINSYAPIKDGWEILICNGVEYASWQEYCYNADTLTGNYEDFIQNHSSYFKPIS